MGYIIDNPDRMHEMMSFCDCDRRYCFITLLNELNANLYA